MKKATLIIIAILCAVLMFSLTGCAGSRAAVPTPSPSPSPTPTPTPSPEPVLSAGYFVTADGTELKSGSYIMNGVECVSLEELAKAIGVELKRDDKTISFDWRGDKVQVMLDSDEFSRGEEEKTLPCKVFSFHGASFVPLEELCDSLDISLYYDQEFSRMYCTPGAGDWELPVGVKVPVFMYHCVLDVPGADLFVSPADMEAQIKYLLDNGYEPIWFEDLEHVDEYDKPVILTFDDGYDNNYSELYPIVIKYQVKISICMITSYIDHPWGGYLTSEQIKEMSASGLVAFESHTVTHQYLEDFGAATQEIEMRDSELTLIRLTGKEPVMLCYPTGTTNGFTFEVLPKYYRFGMKMTGPTYVTGDDPTLVWRIFIRGGDGLQGFINKLDNAYN